MVGTAPRYRIRRVARLQRPRTREDISSTISGRPDVRRAGTEVTCCQATRTFFKLNVLAKRDGISRFKCNITAQQSSDALPAVCRATKSVTGRAPPRLPAFGPLTGAMSDERLVSHQSYYTQNVQCQHSNRTPLRKLPARALQDLTSTCLPPWRFFMSAGASACCFKQSEVSRQGRQRTFPVRKNAIVVLSARNRPTSRTHSAVD